MIAKTISSLLSFHRDIPPKLETRVDAIISLQHTVGESIHTVEQLRILLAFGRASEYRARIEDYLKSRGNLVTDERLGITYARESKIIEAMTAVGVPNPGNVIPVRSYYD